MKVWTSGEVMVDVHEPFRTARQVVEQTLNAVCESRSIGSMVGGPIASRLVACFVERTRVLTHGGYRCVEDLQQADRLAARDEHDLHAPVEFKPIEEVFIRNAHVMFVSIAGRRIGTTAEHPFYVQGRGWTPAGELALGDLVASHDGQWNPVTALDFTGEVRRVYNFRIADHHTYFVGDDDWGFSVWVHNALYQDDQLGLLGVTEDVPEDLVYIVWASAHEPEIWSYSGMRENRYRNLAEFLESQIEPE
jgi:hypothetical protein